MGPSTVAGTIWLKCTSTIFVFGCCTMLFTLMTEGAEPGTAGPDELSGGRSTRPPHVSRSSNARQLPRCPVPTTARAMAMPGAARNCAKNPKKPVSSRSHRLGGGS